MNTAAPPTVHRRALRWLIGQRRRLSVLLVCGFGLATMSTCSPRLSALEEIKALGALRVITTNSPTTYYVGAGGPAGFEYDLAKVFADSLGVQLQVVIADSTAEALRMLLDGRGHLAAARIAVSEERERAVRFSSPVMSVEPQLVYQMGRRKPRHLGELEGRLRVPAGGASAEMLQNFKAGSYPDLVWEESADQDIEELLYLVAAGDLDYTIASSDVVAIHQRYNPRLRVAFTLAGSQKVAWALRPGPDASLFEEVENYLARREADEMARLRDRYFGHSEQVDYVSTITLVKHLESRLPPLRETFVKAAESVGVDWRLLAAMGYQESHWNPAAVSPTGVRGIMMLTMDTAAFLRVTDREDPVQSIFGGARYFRQLLDQLPPEIQEPERTWMALAAYNMGIGHLLDAREVTRRTGGDPNRWLDVRNALPLLTQAKWNRTLKYGYARGYEAITYVGNVRTYYDMLIWMLGDQMGAPQGEVEPPLEIPDVQPEDVTPLNITSPVL
jgi:membrane-bound lytic murein transglycosylase F